MPESHLIWKWYQFQVSNEQLNLLKNIKNHLIKLAYLENKGNDDNIKMIKKISLEGWVIVKKFLGLLLVLGLSVSVAACSQPAANTSQTNNSESSKAKTQQDSMELTEKEKGKVYTFLRVAEDKVNILFHKNKANNNTPLLDRYFDKESAAKFLSDVYDKPVVDQIITHYITDKKIEEVIVVNDKPFFEKPVQKTNKEDVKVEGTKDAIKAITKDGVEYDLKMTDGKLLIMNIKK